MARTTLSSAALKAFFSQESSDYPILLLTFTHESLSDPILISTDSTQRISENATRIVYGTKSRSKNFIYYPLELSLPLQDESEAPKATLKLDNVGRDLVPTIRSLQSPPYITIEVVMSCSPDVVEITFPDFEILKFEYDATTVSCDLVLDQFAAESFPAGTFNSDDFGGMF